MIRRIRLIQKIGNFDSVDTATQIDLGQLVLVYGENGRGKTTLAAVFRSLASGESTPILERQRLTTDEQPHVVLDCDGEPPTAVFQGGQWNRKLPQLAVFDDVFIHENVHSGLSVDSRHRKNLHGVVLGSRGVELQQRLENIVKRAERHNSALREKSAAIPESVRFGLTIDQFCDLPKVEDTDFQIKATKRTLAAARDRDAVNRMPLFESFELPDFAAEAIADVLGRSLRDLDATSDARVRAHFESLGPGGERWVSDGIQRLSPSVDEGPCPFCAQDLSASDILAHYRVYFSEEYAELKRSIEQTLAAIRTAHGGDAPARFERALSATIQRRGFWSRFCDIPGIEIDSDVIVRNWRSVRESVLDELRSKRNSPLERRSIPHSVREAMSSHNSHRQMIEGLSNAIAAANSSVLKVKEQAAGSSPELIAAKLKRLRAIASRYCEVNEARWDHYLAEKQAKDRTNQERERIIRELREYRVAIFPQLENSINGYLNEFSAGFRLSAVAPVNIRGGASCTYSIAIEDKRVDVSQTSTDGRPSFGTTLSSGDRSTLALAFFFATLDHDPDLGGKVVVNDDPKSSLDEHRSLTTVQIVRRLSERVEQLLILSHDKRFLCSVWSGSDRPSSSAVEIARSGSGSTLREWPVHEESFTEHDRRHLNLVNYVESDIGDHGDIARCLRPHLEGFLRVARPSDFRPETRMGNFLQLCCERLGKVDEILDCQGTRELSAILEFANRFHHAANPARREEVINDAELLGFVKRVLDFAHP